MLIGTLSLIGGLFLIGRLFLNVTVFLIGTVCLIGTVFLNGTLFLIGRITALGYCTSALFSVQLFEESDMLRIESTNSSTTIHELKCCLEQQQQGKQESCRPLFILFINS